MFVNKPKLAIARPTASHAQAAAQAKKLAGQGTIRLVLELAPATRQALKVRAAQEGVTLKGYLLRLAARDGVKVSEPID
jgi:hypothetical protein